MKKSILFSLFLGAIIVIQAQTYNFSQSKGDYTNLVGGTSLTNGLTWDDPDQIIPIGFSFKLFGRTTTQLYNSSYWTGCGLNGNNLDTSPLLLPFQVDLIDRGYKLLVGDNDPSGLSNISYTTTGVAGSKVFKLEFRNVGFYGDSEDDDICQDSANFQLWLYEGSNNIEFRFGKSYIANLQRAFQDEPGPSVGIWPQYDYLNDMFNGKGFALRGDPTFPIVLSDGADTIPFLTGMIPDSTIYKFEYSNAASIKDIADIEKAIEISPIPAKNFIEINTSYSIENKVFIIDAVGKSIETHINDGKVDISVLPVGVYHLQMQIADQIVTKRFVKSN